MKLYESWDFCKSINCNALIRPEELRKQTICGECTAYKMHQYLKENGQIFEEDGKLFEQIKQIVHETEMAQLLAVNLDSSVQSGMNTITESLVLICQLRADNAAMLEGFSEIKDYLTDGESYVCGQLCDAYVENPHPGTAMLQELEQYKKAFKLACEMLPALPPSEGDWETYLLTKVIEGDASG